MFHANQTTKCLRNQGRTKGEGWLTANWLKPPPPPPPPVIFIAGRPKAALLFFCVFFLCFFFFFFFFVLFFGNFRCSALLFMVIHVIYKYKK